MARYEMKFMFGWRSRGEQVTLPILKIGCKLTAVEYGSNLAELCGQKRKHY